MEIKGGFIIGFLLLVFPLTSAITLQENTQLQTTGTNTTFIMGNNLTFNGIEVHSTYLKLDNNTISATPSVGSVNITIINFTNAYKKWNETANSGATVSHIISNFTANTQLLVKKDSVAWTGLTSNSTGYISFSYSGSYPVTFELEAGTMPVITPSDGGGGGGPTLIFIRPISFTSTPVKVGLTVDDKATFSFNKVTHTIEATNITADSAIFKISSIGQTVELKEGESEDIDLDNDNIYDLRLTLDYIYGSRKAFILIKKISAAKEAPKEEKKEKEKPIVEKEEIVKEELREEPREIWKEEPETNYGSFIFALVIVVLVVVIVVLIINYKRKK